MIPFLFLITYSCPAFAQYPDTHTPFYVIDIQRVSPTYAIVSCIGEFGRTIQVEFKSMMGKPNPKIIKSYNDQLNAITPGTVVKADLTAGKAWINFVYTIAYKLLTPVLSPQCCVITKIARVTYDKKDYFLTAKQDTANGLTYLRVTSWYYTPDIRFQSGQPIYEKNYNNTRYGVLKGTYNKYLSYSYQVHFATNEWYNTQPLETVNSMSPGAPPIDSANQAQTQQFNTSTQQWEILPDNTLTGATGQLLFQMPTNISYAHLKVFISGDTKMAASLFGNSKSKLLPGNYDLLMDKYSIKNVPVEKGKTTRLKVGILNYSPRGPVKIVDENNQKIAIAGPFKIALPPGTYYLDGKKEHSFVIKDGEVTEY